MGYRGLLVAAAVLACAAPARAGGWTSPVDQLLGRCPTAAELASVARVQVTVDPDVAAGPPVCGDLVRAQEHTVQALLVMQQLQFPQPLPWTPKPLFDWFADSVHGVRIADLPFAAGGYCCNPDGVLVIGDPGFADVTRFADPAHDWNGPVVSELETLVHEARHANGAVHQCPLDDDTISELGAWGVEYSFDAWVALYGGAFMTSPDVHPAAYRDGAFFRAGVWRQHACKSGFADLTVTIKDTPDPVQTGATLTYAAIVGNNGPAQADGVLFYEDVPLGTHVKAAAPSQGTCTSAAESNTGAVGCRLGSIAAGAAATVRIDFAVDAPAGTLLHNVTPETQVLVSGGSAISEEREPAGLARQNQVASVQTRVIAKPKAKPPPKRKPKRKKPKPKKPRR